MENYRSAKVYGVYSRFSRAVNEKFVANEKVCRPRQTEDSGAVGFSDRRLHAKPYELFRAFLSIFPRSFFGSDATNSTQRGYL